MHTSLLLLPALGAFALAAPAYPELNMAAAQPGSLDVLSDYFDMLAAKVQQSRYMSKAPVCDLSQAKQPQVTPPLPPPSQGLYLKHVAIGRGVQNYTCDLANATAVPVAVGAVATLYNASCVASVYPDLLTALPNVALQFKTTPGDARLAVGNHIASGRHYFTNNTTPFFDLDTSFQQLGHIAAAKNNTSAAPTDAPKGPNGEAAVAWLKLLSRPSLTTGDLTEVYRLETAGGSAPATCKDQQAAFSIQYAAQYWFYAGKPTTS